MILINATKKTTVADQCHFADTILKRMVGLLNRRSLATGEGLLLDRCYGIHTFFMRFAIDVLFLDKEYRVMRVVKALPPFRTCAVQHAIYVLELPAGMIDHTHTEAGDQIQIRTGESNVAKSPRPTAPAPAKVQV